MLIKKQNSREMEDFVVSLASACYDTCIGSEFVAYKDSSDFYQAAIKTRHTSRTKHEVSKYHTPLAKMSFKEFFSQLRGLSYFFEMYSGVPRYST